MKITHIGIQNFLAISDIRLTVDRSVVLVAGGNEQGKTSMQEAIRLALTGEAVRVSLKKDYPAMVRDGAKAAAIHITADTLDAAITLPDGKRTLAGDHHSGALPFVLDPARFSGLSETDRRSMLCALTGTSSSPTEVSQKLIARGCDPDKVEAVSPMLVSGFPAAHDYAKTKAAECRGAWKQVTGETYGEKKAETWKSEKPKVNEEAIKAASATLACLVNEIEATGLAIGELSATKRQQERAKEKADGLRERAGLINRIITKLETDRRELAEWQAKVSDTRAKAGGTTKAPTTHPCPCCGAVLMHRLSDGALIEYEAPSQQADPESASALPEYERALSLIERAVANGERDLAAAREAAAEIKSLESISSDPIDQSQLSELEMALASLKEAAKAQEAIISAGDAARRKADIAEEKTMAAAENHRNLKGWIKIAEALAPDGIPGEMLAGAIKPINDRLRITAAATGWAQVSVDPDMSVRIGGRLYGLCSESSRWRGDTALAEAIAHVSGLRLIALDRMDVLDLPGRSSLLRWLHGLASAGEIDTALVFATLKGLPQVPADTFQTLWLERGEISQYQAAA